MLNNTRECIINFLFYVELHRQQKGKSTFVKDRKEWTILIQRENS